MTREGDLFREALEAAQEDDLFGQVTLSSLLSIAASDPELQGIADAMLSPPRAELDLHLDGTTVHDHETTALPSGAFITRTATTVKELAKQASGVRRLATRLQVVAPSPGSVRVVFRAPPAP